MAGVTHFGYSFFAFVLILIPLVVFHELGHYLFAKCFGVKAQVFSVGFGPELWGRTWGETRWRIALIPLGGYVKLLGEDAEAEVSEAERARSLTAQVPWKRFLIFFGGPLFNFILAVLIFMGILIGGEPHVASVVGRVVEGSAAQHFGFRTADRILSLQGKSVTQFEEVVRVFHDHPGETLDCEVIHEAATQSVHLKVTPVQQSGLSLYGEPTQVGEVQGLFAAPRGNQLGVAHPNSMAGLSGLQTGDRVVACMGKSILHWEQFEKIYRELPRGQAFEIQFQKKGAPEGQKFAIEWIKPEKGSSLAKDFGLYSSELFVDQVLPGSPAEAIGIRSGDRLIAVGNQEVFSFFELKDRIQHLGETQGEVKLHWESQGVMHDRVIQPTGTPGRDLLLKPVIHYTIGITSGLIFGEPEMVIKKVWNPIALIQLAVQRMWEVSWHNFVSLKKLVTGRVSVGALHGPLMIGKLAGESLVRGWFIFFNNMAIFSIGLGVLNILPIPVLDGGHMLLLGVEILRRKPLTVRQMEVLQGIGLVLVLLLMGIAFRNDLARLIYS